MGETNSLQDLHRSHRLVPIKIVGQLWLSSVDILVSLTALPVYFNKNVLKAWLCKRLDKWC